MPRPPFSPIAVVQALNAEGVRYVVIGALVWWAYAHT